jgi:hypothetical protein
MVRDSVFGDKFTANVDTVFYQRKVDEDSIYYFKDGKYAIAKYSQEVVIRIDNNIIITKISSFEHIISVDELNQNFVKKANAIDIEKERDVDMFYVYSGWKYLKVMVNNKWFHVSRYQFLLCDSFSDYEK